MRIQFPGGCSWSRRGESHATWREDRAAHLRRRLSWRDRPGALRNRTPADARQDFRFSARRPFSSWQKRSASRRLILTKRRASGLRSSGRFADLSPEETEDRRKWLPIPQRACYFQEKLCRRQFGRSARLASRRKALRAASREESKSRGGPPGLARCPPQIHAGLVDLHNSATRMTDFFLIRALDSSRATGEIAPCCEMRASLSDSRTQSRAPLLLSGPPAARQGNNEYRPRCASTRRNFTLHFYELGSAGRQHAATGFFASRRRRSVRSRRASLSDHFRRDALPAHSARILAGPFTESASDGLEHDFDVRLLEFA